MFNRSQIKFALGLPLAALVLVCGSASTHAQTVILDQVGTTPATFNTANSFASNHYTDVPGSSSVLVDDFTAPASALDITNVTAAVVGFGGTFKSLANVTGWEVAIFTSVPTAATSISGNYNATVPASGVTLTTPYDTSANSGLVSIPVNITLPAAGTYYIAVEADNSLSANGEVAVYSTAKGFLGAPAPFPAGGENDFDFNPNPGLFGSVITGETGDASYKVTAVPEPSTWALLGLGALAGTVCIARRQGCGHGVLPA